MIIAIFGGDEARIRDRLQELRAEADGGSGMLDSNLNVIDGRTTRPAEILGPVMSVPFLSVRRLVIVERLLERYEPRYERAGPRSMSPVEPLLEGLRGGIPETTVLVFLGLPFKADAQAMTTIPVTKRNPLVKEVEKLPGVRIEDYPAPDAKSLPGYIEREAKARGLRFKAGRQGFAAGEEIPRDAGPAALLAAITHGNTLSIGNELDKLALYTGGGDVTMADVNRVCAGERIAGAFELADAVMDGNLARALEALKLLRDDGEDVGATLSNLVSRYRALAPVVELVAEGASTEEIGQAMGNAGRYPGLRDTAIRRARVLGPDGFRRAYEALVRVDRDSKAGDVDRELALELALGRLCELSRR